MSGNKCIELFKPILTLLEGEVKVKATRETGAKTHVHFQFGVYPSNLTSPS
jgi:hypothetical protein